MASKRLGPLPRIRRGALGRGCGRDGSGALPLPRAAVISTRLRVRVGGDAEAGRKLVAQLEAHGAVPEVAAFLRYPQAG